MRYQEHPKGRRDEYVEPARHLHAREAPSGARPLVLLLILVGLLGLVLVAISDDQDAPGAEAPASVQAEPSEAHASVRSPGKLISGVASIRRDQEFCFSLGKAVSQAADFRFRYDPGWGGPDLDADRQICLVGAWDLADVKAAPELDPRLSMLKGLAPRPRAERYDGFQPLSVGDCYVILCSDGIHFAKIRVIEFDISDRRNPTLTFQWAYQPDGSRSF